MFIFILRWFKLLFKFDFWYYFMLKTTETSIIIIIIPTKLSR